MNNFKAGLLFGLCFLLVLGNACNSQKTTDYDLFNFLEEMNYKGAGKKYYCILTIDNCSACIQEYKDFISRYANDEDVLLIISSSNKKNISFFIGENKSSNNIITDENKLVEMKYHLTNNKIKLFVAEGKKVIHEYEFFPSDLPKKNLKKI